MKFNFKSSLIFLLITIVLLCGISAVSAADTDDTMGETIEQEVSTLDTTISEDVVETNENANLIDEEGKIEKIDSAKTRQVKSDSIEPHETYISYNDEDFIIIDMDTFNESNNMVEAVGSPSVSVRDNVTKESIKEGHIEWYYDNKLVFESDLEEWYVSNFYIKQVPYGFTKINYTVKYLGNKNYKPSEDIITVKLGHRAEFKEYEVLNETFGNITVKLNLTHSCYYNVWGRNYYAGQLPNNEISIANINVEDEENFEYDSTYNKFNITRVLTDDDGIAIVNLELPVGEQGIQADAIVNYPYTPSYQRIKLNIIPSNATLKISVSNDSITKQTVEVQAFDKYTNKPILDTTKVVTGEYSKYVYYEDSDDYEIVSDTTGNKTIGSCPTFILTLPDGSTRNSFVNDEGIAVFDDLGLSEGNHTLNVKLVHPGYNEVDTDVTIDVHKQSEPVVDNKTDDNSTDSNVTDSNKTDVNLTESNVTDSNITDSNITDSNITDGNITDDNVTDTNVTNTNGTNSNVTNNVSVNKSNKKIDVLRFNKNQKVHSNVFKYNAYSKTMKKSVNYTVYYNDELVYEGNNLTLDRLNNIFNQDFINGTLLIYVDGELIFNDTVDDNISSIIMEIIDKYFGSHEIKINFTENNETIN